MVAAAICLHSFAEMKNNGQQEQLLVPTVRYSDYLYVYNSD